MTYINPWNHFCLNNYNQGRGAEFVVQHELKKLPSTFIVRSNHQGGYGVGDLDALVIGPTGVFTIEIKSHRGHIVYRNHELHRLQWDFEKNFIEQCLRQRYYLEEVIKNEIHWSPIAQAILVFTSPDAFICLESERPHNVHIVGKNGLLQTILHSHSMLTKTSVRQIADTINRAPFQTSFKSLPFHATNNKPRSREGRP